jgi:arylsulfatase A-like enzyme
MLVCANGCQAALSFTDDNVGVVVAAAKTAELYDKSIVVFWGDQ